MTDRLGWQLPAIPAAWRQGVVSIGNFDGVHRGHHTMLQRLREAARRVNGPAVVVTFDPHPLAYLRPGSEPPSLTTIEDRVALLRQAGADAVCVLPTTPGLLQLTAAEFFTSVLVDGLAARGVVEGPNFFFGKDRAGNITVLRELCSQQGMTLEVIEAVTVEGQWVSSSVIRSLLVSGHVAAAAALLGRSYRLTGCVSRGAGRGRSLGIPTANLTDVQTVFPAHGVYVGEVTLPMAVGQGPSTYRAAINIGPNPTFGEQLTKLEVLLLDFSGDLYGQSLTVALWDRLREVRKFASVDDFQQQLARDLQTIRTAPRPECP